MQNVCFAAFILYSIFREYKCKQNFYFLDQNDDESFVLLK